jgi:DNA-binding MarR family transcriptional regulator
MKRRLSQHMLNPDLSANARLTLYVLAAKRKRDGYSYLTAIEISKILSISDETMVSVSRELIEAGLVRREKGRRRWALLGLVAAAAIATTSVAPASAEQTKGVGHALHFADIKKRKLRRSTTEQDAAA